MYAAAIRSAPVVEAQRTDRRIEAESDADAPVHILRFKSSIPRTAKVGEDRSRHLGNNRETIFERGQRHAIAAELILAVAADRILTADAELVVLGNRSLSDAVLSAQNKDLCMARLEVMRVADRILLEREVPAEAGKLRRKRGARP